MDVSTNLQILTDLKPIQITRLMLLAPLIILLITWYIQWKRSRKHMYELSAHIPHPAICKLPIIGHAHHFTGGTERITRGIFKIFKSKTPTTVWLGHRLFYCLSNPEDLEVVMNSQKCIAKDDLYRFARRLVGLSLFSAPVPKWRKNRKMISPAFNKTILNNFVEIFAQQAVIFGNNLECKGDSYFDILHLCENFTLDILCESSLGIKLQAQTTNCILAKNIEMLAGLDMMMTRMYNVIYHSDLIYNLLPISRREQKVCDIVRNFSKDIIRKKQIEYKIRQEEKLLLSEAEINENDKKSTFLDLLIELQANGTDITDEDILDETTVFLIGGSDTSATTLSFVFVLLGMFPQYQQKVYEEVIENIGTDRLVECTDLSKLVYTEQFIKETMRIFPIGPTIVRKVEDDTDLGHCILPKGAGLVLGILACHRNPEIYPDPLKFDPERFTAKEISKRHPYAYLPFSGGPRNCIGLKYAMMSMKTLVAMLVRRFYFKTSYQKIEDIEIKQALIIRATKGYPVKVTKRN